MCLFGRVINLSAKKLCTGGLKLKNERNKKVIRKLLCVALAAVTLGAYVGTTLPQYTGTGIVAQAANSERDFYTEENGDGTISITGYKGTSSNVVIPSYIFGEKVTVIHSMGDGAKYITSVTIPNSVTEIRGYAFIECTKLKSVTIPNSITEIGLDTFRGCTELTSIKIPNSVTEIGSGAFSGCTGLKSVTIPNGVTYIGGSAFLGCTGLTSITIPNGVNRINSMTFRNCTGLTNITIPNSVTEIDSDAFLDCTGLKSVTIPDSVTEIGSGAFAGCAGLTSVTIPNSVTKIIQWTFEDCTGLTSIIIPDSVTEIDEGAFSGCENLTIYGKKNSYADKYANNHDIPFKAIVDVKATGVKLNTTRTWLGRGESYQLNATVSPSNATNKKITWTSSNNNIATVSNGKVTAKKDGTVTITAKTSNGKTATCKITVQPPASKISLNKSTLYLGVGEKFQLTSSVQSGTASAKRGFSSSNNNICYTSGSGQLTAKKTGTAYITVKTFNGKTAQCKVVVQPPANKINLNKSTLYLGVGEKFQLTSWVDSGTASTKRAWSSSNNNICYTSSSGQLTAKKTGTAYITVKTFNGKTAQCKVVVQPPASKISLNKSTLYLGVGEKFQLTSWVDSGTASTKRAWSSSNNNICYTSGSGQLTAKKTGTAYITVKTFNGKTAQCKVVVQPPAKAVHISKSWLTLHVGQKFQLSSWVDAGTASTKRAWSSSDNSTVYTSGNGLLTAKKEGTAYITVKTFNGVSSTLKVKVIK